MKSNKDTEKRKEYDKKYYSKNKEQILAKQRERPEKVRKASLKYYHNHREERRVYKKRYYQTNKKEMIAKQKIYQKTHNKEINIQRRKNYQEFPEKIKSSAKKYYHNHKKLCNDYNKKYQKEHPEKVREYSREKRARKLNAPGSHTPEQIEFLRNISGGFCPGYKKPPHWVGKNKLATDHIIPLSKNGSDSIQNIQMMCKSCNSTKGVS